MKLVLYSKPDNGIIEKLENARNRQKINEYYK